MKYFVFLLSFSVLIACQESVAASDEPTENESGESVETSTPDYAVALKFINDYVDGINAGEVGADIGEWLESRTDVTEAFKQALVKMLDEAYKEDPEMGLGFDPILDAQDLPSGFETEREDGEYLVVRGSDWPEFLLTLKLAQVDGKWLVDGAGVVNVPVSRQMKR